MDDRKNKFDNRINILILFGVIVVCLFSAEIILRFAWNGFRPGAYANPFMAYDDTLGWVGKPNYRGLLKEAGKGVSCQINQWGFRDDQPANPLAAEDKKRLLFLGDSFIMGTGVAKNDRVSELIEARDSALVSFNFGILGYSTDQELLVLKKFGPIIKPDYVLLFFCANDLLYNDSDSGHRIPKGHYKILNEDSLFLDNVPVPKLPEPNPVSRWMKDNLALAQIADKLIAQATFRQKRRNLGLLGNKLGLQNTDGESADLDSLLLFSTTSNTSNLTFYLLGELRDECRSLGAKLLLLTTPSNHHWTTTRGDTPAEIQRVLNWCAKLGIETVDLFPEFHRHFIEHRQSLYLPDRMHWNELGNRVAAEALYPLLLKTLADSVESSPALHSVEN